MLRLQINGNVLATKWNQEELTERVARASSLIKTMAGIGNNAAWAACLEALDHVQKHPAYRHRIKAMFKAAADAFRQYEHRLIYAETDRLFRLDDLTPEYRKRYGDITDREYFDFWAATGATTYSEKRQWVMNLWNKYRVSLMRHKMKHECEVAWAMTGEACLRLAEAVVENSIKTCALDYEVPEALLHAIFDQLSVKAVADRWEQAVYMLTGKDYQYELEDYEQKNIQLGLDQLMEEWTSVATLTLSLYETTEAYDDVFRTPGEQKKALRQIQQMGE